MISQTTPAGIRPASRARSTAASVWPERWSTPATASSEREDVTGLDEVARAGRRVDRDLDRLRARSCAEMPVVTPSRASTVTVNAVPNGVSF